MCGNHRNLFPLTLYDGVLALIVTTLNGCLDCLLLLVFVSYPLSVFQFCYLSYWPILNTLRYFGLFGYDMHIYIHWRNFTAAITKTITEAATTASLIHFEKKWMNLIYSELMSNFLRFGAGMWTIKSKVPTSFNIYIFILQYAWFLFRYWKVILNQFLKWNKWKIIIASQQQICNNDNANDDDDATTTTTVFVLCIQFSTALNFRLRNRKECTLTTIEHFVAFSFQLISHPKLIHTQTHTLAECSFE